MDIRKQLLKEHNKANTLKIVDFVDDSKIRFKQLVTIFLAGPYRVTQRAAWPLSICAERNPQFIKPHLKKIMDHIEKPGIHDAAKRNTVRLLQFADVPSALHGRLLNICFRFLQDKKEPVAIKVFSMTVIANIAKDKPEIMKELTIIIQDLIPYSTAAFRSRAARILKRLRHEHLQL